MFCGVKRTGMRMKKYNKGEENSIKVRGEKSNTHVENNGGYVNKDIGRFREEYIEEKYFLQHQRIVKCEIMRINRKTNFPAIYL